MNEERLKFRSQLLPKSHDSSSTKLKTKALKSIKKVVRKEVSAGQSTDESTKSVNSHEQATTTLPSDFFDEPISKHVTAHSSAHIQKAIGKDFEVDEFLLEIEKSNGQELSTLDSDEEPSTDEDESSLHLMYVGRYALLQDSVSSSESLPVVQELKRGCSELQTNLFHGAEEDEIKVDEILTQFKSKKKKMNSKLEDYKPLDYSNWTARNI